MWWIKIVLESLLEGKAYHIWVSLCGVEVKQVLNTCDESDLSPSFLKDERLVYKEMWWTVFVMNTIARSTTYTQQIQSVPVTKQACDESLVRSTQKYPGRIIGTPLYKYPEGHHRNFFFFFFLSNHSFFSSSQARHKHSRLKYRVSSHLRKHLSNPWTRVNLQPHLHSQFYTKTCRPSRTQCPAQTRTQTCPPLRFTIRDWIFPWWMYRNWHEWSIRGMLASTLFRKAREDCGKY